MPSPSFLRAVNAQETDQAFLILLTISHSSLSSPIRVVDNTVDIVSRGETYVAYPFEIALPDDTADGVPRVTLRIDNVSYVDPNDAQEKRISDHIRAIDSPFEVAIEVVLSSDPDVVEVGPYVMTAVKADYNVAEVSAELAFEDVLNEPYPGDSFIPATNPGLF